jgi:PAS domain-containing protein
MTQEITLRALVLASQESVRNQIAAALQAEKLWVSSAPNEAAAYKELARSGTPDLIVAQAAAGPDEDREALLVGMLASPARPPFVVVATDGPSAEQAARLVRRGAVLTLRYPVHPDEARTIFRRVLAQRTKERERTLLVSDVDAMKSFTHDALWNVMDGVLVLDAAGVIVFANPEAARILLQPPELLVGSRLDPKLGYSLLRLLKATRESPTKQAVSEFELVSGEEKLKVLGRGSIVHDHLHQPVAGLLVLRVLDPKSPGVAGAIADAARQGSSGDLP